MLTQTPDYIPQNEVDNSAYDEKHAVHDIVLKNITWNGVAIHESGEYGLVTNEFCRNVTIE